MNIEDLKEAKILIGSLIYMTKSGFVPYSSNRIRIYNELIKLIEKNINEKK